MEQRNEGVDGINAMNMRADIAGVRHRNDDEAIAYMLSKGWQKPGPVAAPAAATPSSDGGQAFPEPGLSGLPNGEFIQSRPGMSLRDYLAIHAEVSGHLEEDGCVPLGVAQLLMGSAAPDYSVGPVTALRWWAEAEARLRYMKADAMLRAREVNHG